MNTDGHHGVPKNVEDVERLFSGGIPTGIDDLALLAEQVKMEKDRREGQMIRSYFPDTGPYRRELYPKHTAFFDAGAIHRERLFLAANRIGKSVVGAYEVTTHLTGKYPHWWKGRKFAKPIRAWASGDTTITTRDIIQHKLLGNPGQYGTGFIPAPDLHHVSHKSGGAVETIWVKHVSGGFSSVNLKSYEQGREAFQGTSIEVIWLDEEPEEDIVTECLLRTMDTPDMPGGGLMILTFTPLRGTTPLVLSYIEAMAQAGMALPWTKAS
jgi:phage terminase large subunit-like protein